MRFSDEDDFWFLDDDEDITNLVTKFEDSISLGEPCFMDVDDYICLVLYYLKNNDLELVKKVFLVADNFFPNNKSLNVYRAYYFAVSNDFVQAKKLLMEADVDDPGLMLAVGDIYRKIGERDVAMKWFDKVLELSGDGEEFKTDAIMFMSDEFMEMGDFDKAIDGLKHIFEIDDSNELIAEMLRNCYDKADMLQDGLTYFKGYVDDKPFSKIGWVMLGRIYIAIEDYVNGNIAFDYALAIDDKYPVASFYKACALMDLEKYSEAIDLFRLVLKYESANASVYYHLGKCYDELSDDKKARNYYEKAIGCGVPPELADLFASYALILAKSEEYLTSIMNINIALDLEPDNVEFLCIKADLLYWTDDTDGAIDSYKRAVSLSENDSFAYLKYASFLEDRGSVKEAIDLLTTALTECNDVNPIMYKLGAIVYFNGNDMLGLDFINEAYNVEPEGLDDLIEHYPQLKDVIEKNINRAL